MWGYAAQGHRLLGNGISPDEAKRNGRRFLVGPICYGVASLIALLAPWVALLIYVALNVFFLWPWRVHANFMDST
jgi:TMEM175 potassium channel family protein